MPVKTLETLRLLTNLETEKRKLLQVILFGQPELDEVLDQPAIRQLKQRITFSHNLLPLNKVATTAYIRHRLTVAGTTQKDLFTSQALDCLYRYSNGIPRLINILCHKALMVAYGEGELQVGLKHMRMAAKDTIETQAPAAKGIRFWLPAPFRWVLTSFCILVVAFSLQSVELPGLF